MKRSLDKLAEDFEREQLEEQEKRHEALEKSVVGTMNQILTSTFPEKSDGSPDWEKFNWDRASELQKVLTQFKAGIKLEQPKTEPPKEPRRKQPEPPEKEKDPTAAAEPPKDETKKSPRKVAGDVVKGLLGRG